MFDENNYQNEEEQEEVSQSGSSLKDFYNNNKKLIWILGAIIIVIIIASVFSKSGGGTSSKKPIVKALNEEEYVQVGTSIELKFKVDEVEGDSKKITWKVENEDIATISGSRVTGKKIGKTVV